MLAGNVPMPRKPDIRPSLPVPLFLTIGIVAPLVHPSSAPDSSPIITYLWRVTVDAMADLISEISNASLDQILRPIYPLRSPSSALRSTHFAILRLAVTDARRTAHVFQCSRHYRPPRMIPLLGGGPSARPFGSDYRDWLESALQETTTDSYAVVELCIQEYEEQLSLLSSVPVSPLFRGFQDSARPRSRISPWLLSLQSPLGVQPWTRRSDRTAPTFSEYLSRAREPMEPSFACPHALTLTPIAILQTPILPNISWIPPRMAGDFPRFDNPLVCPPTPAPDSPQTPRWTSPLVGSTS
ncbi:hypothetical protein NMY22_g10518 [Coprinellus aureogranulatus]|nr:hypothetical protein NMY22_g10518 [Coprinellus aureogranulatus]